MRKPKLSTSDAGMDFLLANCPWWPQEGPQEQAFDSEADMVLYGGAAGGGKTALAIGLALVSHRETLFIRREAKQLGGVLDEVANIIDTDRDGYSGQSQEWKIPEWDGVKRKIVFGSTPNLGNETRYQGRARDLLIIDEAANMIESQVSFLRGWVRSTVPGQRCRTLLCSNPPTSGEGSWLREWFAPWLDPHHDNPALPGELRWYAAIDGKEVIVENSEPFDHNGERVIPQSRTFIPAKVTDNKYLRDTGYVGTLQALPEPLRSQMLYGDFAAGLEDAEYQVIPSEWVKAAQDRYVEKPFDPKRITSAGLDPSRGGRDDTVLALREGWHYHPLHKWPGAEMDTGGKVAAKTIDLIGTSSCPIHIDVIGIGASVLDHLTMIAGSRAIAVNASTKSEEVDWSGNLTFANKRAEMWWRFRDMLNPANGKNVALPPDTKLAAELCAPTYKLRPAGILIESKDDIKKRLGRSTDSADAVVQAGERTPVVRIVGGPTNNVRVAGSLRR